MDHPSIVGQDIEPTLRGNRLRNQPLTKIFLADIAPHDVYIDGASVVRSRCSCLIRCSLRPDNTSCHRSEANKRASATPNPELAPVISTALARGDGWKRQPDRVSAANGDYLTIDEARILAGEPWVFVAHRPYTTPW